MPDDYYIILGIPNDSSQDDIRAAYRRLAKELHPDRYGKNQGPFQAIQEAYSVLSNPESRKSYDYSLQSKSTAVTPLRRTSLNRYADENIEPLIAESYGHRGNLTAVNRPATQKRFILDTMVESLVGGYQQGRDPEMISAADVSLEISLSAIDARRGGNVGIELPIRLPCPSCSRHRRHGTGCWHCSGTGSLRSRKSVILRYPPGIRDNQYIKFTVQIYAGRDIFVSAFFKII
jgi:molecular chaperone DnaJ